MNVGYIGMCNQDFHLDEPFNELLEKAYDVAAKGVEDGLLDEDDVFGGNDPELSICASDWVDRLEDAGFELLGREFEGGPGMSDTSYDIHVSSERDEEALREAFDRYIKVLKTHMKAEQAKKSGGDSTGKV